MRPKVAVAAVVALLLAGAGGAIVAVRGRLVDSAGPPDHPPPAGVGVGALGRLEPGWKVYQVAPATSADGARLESLVVEEGDEVAAGAVLATLDTRGRREAALQEARAQLLINGAKLALIKAGAKADDVTAQASAVDNLRVAVRKADAEFKRADGPRSAGAMTSEEYDQRRFQLQMAQATLRQAESTLAGLKLVRPEDVAVAEAEVAKAEAGVARAAADLEATAVRSPTAGRVLSIHARAGEKVGESGVAEIGDTAAMHAVAEVYEGDVPKVAVGRRATVHLQTAPGPLAGEVVRVGWKVGRRVTLDNDPVKDTDARVVEVRVRLDPAASARVARLSYARVEVRIDPAGGR